MRHALGYWQGRNEDGSYVRPVLTDRRFYAYGLLEPPARAYRVLTDFSDHWVGEITGAKPGDELHPHGTTYRKVATAVDCVSAMRFVDLELFGIGWVLGLRPRERVEFQLLAWSVARTGGSPGWFEALDESLFLFSELPLTVLRVKELQKTEILKARGRLRPETI